jgi:DNA-binding CsgD family transcriptional regulator
MKSVAHCSEGSAALLPGAAESDEIDVRVPPELCTASLPFQDDGWVVLSYSLHPACELERLTESEAVVALLAMSGLSNLQIAHVRSASQRTIANQLASVYRKLGGASRACLAAALAKRPHAGASHEPTSTLRTSGVSPRAVA